MSGHRIGVIGLGAMGRPMSARLAQAGYDVIGYDLSQDALHAAPHVRAATTVRELVSAVDRVVISVVRTLSQTEAVVAEVDREDLILIIMSTIGPGAMERVEQELSARRVTVIDAPVSGGVQGAQAGALAIMIAGPTEAVHFVRPLLEAMGSNLFHIGQQPGVAQTVKLANQMMLAINMMGVFEAMRLAASNGVDAEQMLPAVAVSTGSSWVSQNWDTVLGFWREYRPGAELDLIHKDMTSALAEAAQRHVGVPVTGLAFQLLHDAWKLGTAASR
jgi:3-hydroxyisobutyrate dehydrogenase